MTAPQPVHIDGTATVHVTVRPDGRPAVLVTGTCPAADGFTAWAETIRSLTGIPGLGGILDARLDERGHAVLIADATGTTLAERLAGTGPISATEATGLFAVLAGALNALHATGLRHGGICPSTVVLGTDGSRLAGLDAATPGLEAPVPPSTYLAPEGPGQPSDVHALAATAYTALGGVLPFAADPADQILRRQVAADIPGVPAELTDLLRSGMHPVPERRATAAALAEGLAAITAEPSAVSGIPMAAADVGAPVRPVNEAVVSINLAATTGIAATAGIAAGQAVGGTLSGGSAAKAGASGLGFKIGAGVAAAALVAAAVVVGVNLLNDDPQGTDSAGGPGPMNEAIRGFDVANADFLPGRVFDPGTDEEPTVFRDGIADGSLTGPDEPYGTYQISEEPVYADLDGDNDLDLAQWVVVQAGGGPRFLYFWEWDGEKAVQSPYVAIHEEGCAGAVQGLEPGANGGVDVTMSFVYTCGAPGPESDPETITLGLRDHLPVQVAPAFGAAGSCFDDVHDGLVHTDLTAKATPLLVPDDGAAPVGAPGEFTRIDSYHWDLGGATSPWHLARLTRADGGVACGWIPPGTIA